MKLSQKELEMLSSTDIDALLDTMWWYIKTPPNVISKEEKGAHVQRLRVLSMATDTTSGRQRRVIDRLMHEVNMAAVHRQGTGEFAPDVVVKLDDLREELKAAFRGEFFTPIKHVSTHLADVEELFVIQLVPAFQPHPEFPVTYYAGYFKSPKWEAEQTNDIHAAARWSAKDEAQKVADALLPSLSCVWKVVEA
jgi:hypothetical protein